MVGLVAVIKLERVDSVEGSLVLRAVLQCIESLDSLLAVQNGLQHRTGGKSVREEGEWSMLTEKQVLVV